MESKPLSPHLQIYRPQLTSVLSISHRASGIFLGTAGLLALVAWLGSIALGPSQYEMTMNFLRHPLMLPVLLLWTGAFYYHLSNGIRHLFWDMGVGFELSTAYRSGYAVVGSTVALTSATWIYAFFEVIVEVVG